MRNCKPLTRCLPLSTLNSQLSSHPIQRTADAGCAKCADMGIDHGRTYVSMPQQFLNGVPARRDLYRLPTNASQSCGAGYDSVLACECRPPRPRGATVFGPPIHENDAAAGGREIPADQMKPNYSEKDIANRVPGLHSGISEPVRMVMILVPARAKGPGRLCRKLLKSERTLGEWGPYSLE